MENKFRKVAQKQTSLSSLMEGKDLVKMEDIMRDYPDGITVIGFDMINTGEDSFPVLVFAEDRAKFFFGGSILNKICREWADLYEGDIDAASTDLAGAGGVAMRFEKTRTKTGNNLIKPVII